MENGKNLLDLIQSMGAGDSSALESVRLDDNETAVIPFTADYEPVDVHYCSEPDLTGYVHCNGTGCVLCRIGRKCERRLLVPVYLPSSRVVAVLPVSTSMRPNALLPQLGEALKGGKPVVVFVRREGAKFYVAANALRDGMDDGAAAVAAFQKQYADGAVKLASVFQTIGDEQLARVPEIQRLLALKEAVA